MTYSKLLMITKTYRSFGLTVVLVSLLVSTCSLANGLPSIHVSKGKYSDYYHISFRLTPDNSTINLKTGEGDRSYGFVDENGQFEVYIDRNAFPVDAPNCKNDIILRMPATNPFGSEAEKSISEKRQLYNQIKNMIDNKQGELDVVIELNPYVKKVSDNPLKLELTQCNVFFRHARNHYINYIGPLK